MCVAAAALSLPVGAQGLQRERPDLPLPLDRSVIEQSGVARSNPSTRLPRADGDGAPDGPVRGNRLGGPQGGERDKAEEAEGPFRGVTVQERPRPEYSTDPVPVGAFLLSAEGGARVGYDANVFRQRDGASDAYGQLTASGRLVSNTSRNLLLLEASAAERAYTKYTTESAFTYSGHAGGRLDLGQRDTLSFDVRHEHDVRERNTATEIIATRRPVRYDLTSLVLSGHKMMGRFGLDVAGMASRQNYEDGETPGGVPLDFDVRNSRTYGARVDVSYELGPGPVAFLSVGGAQRRYDQRIVQGFRRDSNQLNILAGLRGYITPLLRGQIGLGYLRADFKDGRSKGGIGADGHLDYLLTELTTLSLDARREFRNTSSITTPEALASRVTLQADHELLRNLILSATVVYDRATYIDDDGGSTEVEGRVGASYLINRRFRVSGSIGYRDRNGFGRIAERDYGQLAANVGITARL